MNFKTLFFLFLAFSSITIFAQNSSNPYREFVERELAKSLEDTITLPIKKDVSFTKKGSIDCASVAKIFPQRKYNYLDEEIGNMIYISQNNSIGVLWLRDTYPNYYVPQNKLATQKYRLLVIDLNESILYAKTYLTDTVATIKVTEKMIVSRIINVKSCPYESDNESDETLMQKEVGIVLNFADSTQQQKIEQDLAKYCNTKNLIMNKLIEAYYCEVNGYLANAIGLYQEVMAAEPNNLHYKKLYKNFLKVTGMDFIR